jgi:hypothetical protein
LQSNFGQLIAPKLTQVGFVKFTAFGAQCSSGLENNAGPCGNGPAVFSPHTASRLPTKTSNQYLAKFDARFKLEPPALSAGLTGDCLSAYSDDRAFVATPFRSSELSQFI